MVLSFVSEGEARGGVREVDPGRDLGVVAGLIAQGFSAEMDDRAAASLREMRRLARLWPWIGWLAEADPILRESLSGFVWEEPAQGERGLQVVANVSLTPAPGARGWSIICNVVTHPEYRRSGIARRLTVTAIEAARERGGEGILLQVYAANEPARRLYTQLGFLDVAGEIDLEADRATANREVEAPGYAIRRLRLSDGAKALALARSATPEPMQWMVPVRPAEYQPDALTALEAWLSGFVAGRRAHRLGAFQGERLAGMLTLHSVRSGPAHRLGLFVDVQDRGRVEEALLSRAMRLLTDRPALPVSATAFQDHPEAVEGLHRLGFRERRTLLVMRKTLR